jgi:hypothetical protein
LGASSSARVRERPEGGSGSPAIPATALIFLLTGIPKLIRMVADFEVDIGYRETVDLVERFLDNNEPELTRCRRSRDRRRHRRIDR